MASSKKTSKLGLNLWEETDKPERLDFVQDNEKLEELVGAHLKASALHLTAEEKERATLPYKIYSYIGNGKNPLAYSVSFEPKMSIVFAVNRPDGMVENGLQSVFRAAKIGSYMTPGITHSGKVVQLSQQTEQEAINAGNGYRLRLNESGVSYCLLIVK